MPERDLDIVLVGATGFTGGLTAEYLARNAPAHLRWALAGRNRAKLEAVRDRLAAIDPRLEVMELLEADTGDRASLDALAARTKVVITTVGPYLEYGGPLVAACAAAGTDYVDLTGEPEFVDRMYVEHHETAVASDARIVHACGFDSIPHDLGAWFTLKHLDTTGPVSLRGVVRSNATFSGGTFHSFLGQASRANEIRKAAAARKRLEKRPEGRRSRAVGGRPHKDPVLGYWLLPLPTIDPQVVARSGATLPSYGPDFRYSHWAGMKTLRMAVGGVAGMAGLVTAAQVKPLRELLGRKVPQGSGPDESRRKKSWFTVDFVGEAAGQTVHTRVSGGDPGYTETSKMLAESALSLALDANPQTAGQVTPVAAMGDSLLERLEATGMTFEVVG